MNTFPDRASRLQSFGAYVRTQRHALGLTQVLLAARLSYNQERVSSIERGVYGSPSLSAMADLADALEIDLLALIEAAGFAPYRSKRAGPGDGRESA